MRRKTWSRQLQALQQCVSWWEYQDIKKNNDHTVVATQLHQQRILPRYVRKWVCEICGKRHRTGMYSSRRWWHSWWYQGHGDTVKSNKSSSEIDDNCNWRKLIPTRSHGQQKLKPSNITYFKIKMLLVTLFKTIWQTLKLAKFINFHFHWQITKSLQITDT